MIFKYKKGFFCNIFLFYFIDINIIFVFNVDFKKLKGNV